MIPIPREEQKKEAFRLSEDGRFQESLEICSAILEEGRDPAIEVLTATNLYYTGKLEDAEVYFRDLARKMPDSSYVHSYLAKVLDALKDEGATAEFAAAVHLDPTNQDALRSYAGYLISRKDYRAALPVLRSLVQLVRRPGDLQNLMRGLIEIGEPEEALTTRSVFGGDDVTPEYIDALIGTGRYPAAAEAAFRSYRAEKSHPMLRRYLYALSRFDVPASLESYAAYIREDPDEGVLSDYILLLKSTKNYGEALAVVKTLHGQSPNPLFRLIECELLGATSLEQQALTAYENLIREELIAKNNLDTLALIIRSYRIYLKEHAATDHALRRFLAVVSRDVNVISLLETARLYADRGDMIEARSWFYRAYRADFLGGGLDYARFLSVCGEERECEKVMLYILSNVKKNTDIERVAAVILEDQGKMSHMKRLMEQLIKKLEGRQMTLNSDGLELLSVAFLIAATSAQEERDYATCKYYCLRGIDVMPAYHRTVRLEQYIQLIAACKESAIADRPIMNAPQIKKHTVAVEQAQLIIGQLSLSEQEKKIVEFLRSHRTASEMDLRKMLGTRRVTGVVNQLIRKASSQGMNLISKKGVGEDGEVYEYTGN